MSSMAPQIGLAMFVAMVLLMALRVPIAASMFIPGLAGYWLMTDTATSLNFLKGSAVARRIRDITKLQGQLKLLQRHGQSR